MLRTKDWYISRDLPGEDLDHHWTQCPSPQPGEVFLSWFTRIAKVNCADPLTLYTHLLGNHASPSTLFARIEMFPKQKALLIAKLEPFVGRVVDQLKLLPKFKGGCCAQNWNFLNLVNESPRYCPSCLNSDKEPYIRHDWHLPFVTACPTHQILLWDCCPHCYSPISYWNSAWNAPMTTCPYCLKELADEEMFIRKLQSREIIQFQQDLLEIYKTETLQKRPIEIQEFFRHLWRIAASVSVDQSIGEFSHESALSTERVQKALNLVLKAIQADGNLIQTPFLEVINKGDKETCDLHDLRNSGEYSSMEWEIAEFRYKIIKPLLVLPHRTALDVNNVANQGNISQKTAYNWIGSYKRGGIKALIPQHKKAGRRRTTYPPEIEVLCDAYIHRHLSLQSGLNPEPIRRSWTRFNNECIRKGWPPSQIPKIGTFYAKYKIIQENLVLKKRISSSSLEIKTNEA